MEFYVRLLRMSTEHLQGCPSQLHKVQMEKWEYHEDINYSSMQF